MSSETTSGRGRRFEGAAEGFGGENGRYAVGLREPDTEEFAEPGGDGAAGSAANRRGDLWPWPLARVRTRRAGCEGDVARGAVPCHKSLTKP